MHDMMGGGWGVGMLAVGLVWLLVLAALVVGLVWLVRAASGGNSRGPLPPARHEGEHPHDVLRRRYAAGELSREEFERMKRELGGP